MSGSSLSQLYLYKQRLGQAKVKLKLNSITQSWIISGIEFKVLGCQSINYWVIFSVMLDDPNLTP